MRFLVRLFPWYFTAVAAAIMGLAPGVYADQATLQRAMRDELARSVAQLKLEKNGPPYFVAYRIEESTSTEVVASFGSLISAPSAQGRTRTVSVEVRVGSMQLDQTNYLPRDPYVRWAPRFTRDLPLDDNYTELRREVWLLTDEAYRHATEELAQKKAALQNKTRPDVTGDFASEPATQTENLDAPLVYNAEENAQTARELSAVFREFPAIDTSEVTIGHREITTHYLNSEGTTYRRREKRVRILIEARTQAIDGRPLSDGMHHFVRSGLIPSRAQLLAETRELGRRLTALRDATVPDTYNGPILFETEAAPDVFIQGLMENLRAYKRPVLENADFPVAENPFQNKIGGRVLPAFLSITDDPTLREYAGQPLFAFSAIDDEGVRARPIKLVDAGRLKTLLTDRVPSPSLTRSTGSRRAGGPFPSNVIVSSNEGLTADALKSQLVKLAQERGHGYGVIVRRIFPEIAAVRIFPDGREELLRNLQLTGLSLESFKDIVAAGQEISVDHVFGRITRLESAPSGGVVSVAAPAVLFDELTLKKPDDDIPTRPVVGHPYFAK